MSEKLPRRKSPIHLAPVSSHNRSIIIFLTVCTEKRKPILAYKDIHQLLIASWRAADAWIVGRYVIMPDHVHLFCAPNSLEPTSAQKWVQFWKPTCPSVGHAPKNNPFGRNPVGRRNFVAENTTKTGGIMFIRIPCGTDWQSKLKTGRTAGELNKLEWHD